MRKEAFFKLLTYHFQLGLVYYCYVLYALIVGEIFNSPSIVSSLLFIPFALYFIFKFRIGMLKFEHEFDVDNGVFNYKRRKGYHYFNVLMIEIIAIVFTIVTITTYTSEMLLYLIIGLTLIIAVEIIGSFLFVFMPFVGFDDDDWDC